MDFGLLGASTMHVQRIVINSFRDLAEALSLFSSPDLEEGLVAHVSRRRS